MLCLPILVYAWRYLKKRLNSLDSPFSTFSLCIDLRSLSAYLHLSPVIPTLGRTAQTAPKVQNVFSPDTVPTMRGIAMITHTRLMISIRKNPTETLIRRSTKL